MNSRKANKFALMCAASVVALTAGARAQQQAAGVETVTVTGSRVISDITLSPTPITAVSAEQLITTTPSTIPDALNKLPDFYGSQTARNQGNGSGNGSSNALNLRNLGQSRTLVLLDGQRVAPGNQNGTVNVDTLPQMLISRVDIVTGGASAVYGSDAVAGVVNFILDKKFTGFKYDINAGISKYMDGAQERIGMAWGTELFGGRGHYEMSVRAFQQDMIPIGARPYGYQGNAWVQPGSGTCGRPVCRCALWPPVQPVADRHHPLRHRLLAEQLHLRLRRPAHSHDPRHPHHAGGAGVGRRWRLCGSGRYHLSGPAAPGRVLQPLQL
jgi:outer membrane receptor protein involved in Fe transport